MKANGLLILCLTYILGAMLTGFSQTVLGLPVSIVIMVVLGGATAAIAPRYWRVGPKVRLWLVAGLIGCCAILYCELRAPQPSSSDISRFQAKYADTEIQIWGRLLDEPRLTRNQKIKFDLHVDRVAPSSSEASDEPQQSESIESSSNSSSFPRQTQLPEPTGKLYVTIPSPVDAELYPGQTIRVTGRLYEPQPAQNPGGFDFKQYLARRGVFVGLSATELTVEEGRSPSLFWRLRHRIVGAFILALGGAEGALLSAMVLGRNAVDLPFDIRDAFNQAGLAHTIAASGFHVSLLLGAVLFFAKTWSAKPRLILGIAALLVYVGLTGVQPSIVRAALMGCAALVGASLDRKTRPVALLVAIATLMLIWNPLWVWDLGFQLSFLATLGLLVTSPVLMKWLDWMPTGIATLVAIPIAAYLWTVPLQLYVFGTVPTYSILLNAIATPLIVVLSLGGMACAAIALASPMLAGIVALSLSPVIWALMFLVNLFNGFPGSVLITGTITAWQVVVLYGLYGLVWWQARRRRLWWIVGLGALALVVIPIGFAQTQLVQVTVLATKNTPAIVIQNHGNTGLIYDGTVQDAEYTVLPFLRQQGIGRLTWAIAPSLATTDSGWDRILQTVSIRTFYSRQLAQRAPTETEATLKNARFRTASFEPGQQVQLGSEQIQFLAGDPCMLRLTVDDESWLVVASDRAKSLNRLWRTQPELAQWLPSDVLWWPGTELDADLLQHIAPQTAIAPHYTSVLDMHHPLRALKTQIYRTDQNGAVQWLPQRGFVQNRQIAEAQS
ncbi:MAG: ComEC/Rec2 family competence protein [Elainellaceae cyanobacterium]